MDQRMLLDHLAMAERHVTQGEARIQRQRELVEELTREGHTDAAKRAVDLLTQFEEMNAFHVADRDRIRKELAKNSN